MNAITTTPVPDKVRAACASVMDPEFGVSIDDLGLIYEVTIAGSAVIVTMTLTTPYCPAGNVIVDGVRAAAERVSGVASVEVRVVWEPTWTPDMVTARGRQQLGWS